MLRDLDATLIARETFHSQSLRFDLRARRDDERGARSPAGQLTRRSRELVEERALRLRVALTRRAADLALNAADRRFAHAPADHRRDAIEERPEHAVT